MIKKLCVTLPFFLLGIIFLGSANANTIEVCNSCAFTSISEAVEKAEPHDTILVKKGT